MEVDVLLCLGVDALKDEQKTILQCLMNKTDCMAVLPTGYGKSLPYQMYSLVNRRLTSDKEIVLVCCPLVALMQDQVEKMSKIPGVKSAYAGSCPQSDIEIKEGKVDIIYASPETLVGDPEWRASIQNLPVSVLVIDEFHTIATWGDDSESQGKETFRKWFNDVGELRSLYPRSSVLALSATCTIKIRKRVMKVLHLADNFKEIVISPNKTNIRISVAKVSNTVETAMHWLIEGLSELKEKFPRTIIYCTSIKDVSEIYSYVTKELPFTSTLLEMFHSETPQTKKQRILESLTNITGEIKIVIATSALGMGLDVKN